MFFPGGEIQGHELCFIENNNYAFNNLIHNIKRIGSVFITSAVRGDGAAECATV